MLIMLVILSTSRESAVTFAELRKMDGNVCLVASKAAVSITLISVLMQDAHECSCTPRSAV